MTFQRIFTLTSRPRLAALLALLVIPTGLRADVLELKTGRQIDGTFVEDLSLQNQVTFELTSGGRVTLDRAQVARVIKQSPAETEYARRSPTVADTSAAQWRLAMWCRKNKLSRESQAHLNRVIELDPAHEEARKLLGYQQVNGRWLTREEALAARGYFRYDGGYHTRQEIERLERSKRHKEVAADWKGLLAKWRRWLTGNNLARSQQAQTALQALNDPAAARPLAALLTREEDYGVRSLLLDIAARFEHPATVQALVNLSLNDPDLEIRMRCLEHLVKARRPGLAAPYLDALQSNNNAKVNRAAEALGEIGDIDTISPLIDALVTNHKFKVGNEGGGDQYSFSPSTGGFQFGGDGPKVVKRDLKNPKALGALLALTDISGFGYDQQAWREWLASQAESSKVDLRRDI